MESEYRIVAQNDGKIKAGLLLKFGECAFKIDWDRTILVKDLPKNVGNP